MLQNITREPEHVRDQFVDDERIWSKETEEVSSVPYFSSITRTTWYRDGDSEPPYDENGDYRQGSFDKRGNSVALNMVVVGCCRRSSGFLEPNRSDLGIDLHN